MIVCEGYSDARFIAHLLYSKGIFGFDVHHPLKPHGQGNSGFAKYLQAASLMSSFAPVIGIVFITDNDYDHSAAFRRVQDTLRNNGFLVPERPFETKSEDGKRKVGIVTLPNGTTDGRIEDVLLEAAFEADPEIKDCISSFAECAGTPQNWRPHQKSKMAIHALIAVKNSHDPAASLAYVWGKSSNPIPIASERFNFLTEYLECFLRDP